MVEEHNHDGKQKVQDQESPTKEILSDAATADENFIVLKVYMHCQACARKVARSLKGFPGVEDVMADSNEGIVRVKGKEADPVKVCQRIQEKTRRKVELISPLPQPPPPLGEEKNQEDKEAPAPTTIILDLQMHCEACAYVIRKKLQKIKGVEFITTDVSLNQVSVTGTVDPSELVNQVFKRTKKRATLVVQLPTPPPPEENENHKDDEEDNKDGETDNNACIKSKDTDKETNEEDVKRNQILPTRHYTDHYLHHTAYPPAPQLFSDENPNACFVM